MDTIFERAKDILNQPHIKKIEKIPKWMPKQRKLVEFAKDAALHIIASQPVNSKETLCKFVEVI